MGCKENTIIYYKCEREIKVKYMHFALYEIDKSNTYSGQDIWNYLCRMEH